MLAAWAVLVVMGYLLVHVWSHMPGRHPLTRIRGCRWCDWE